MNFKLEGDGPMGYTCAGKFNSVKVWAQKLEFGHSDAQMVGNDS